MQAGIRRNIVLVLGTQEANKGGFVTALADAVKIEDDTTLVEDGEELVFGN